LFVIKTALKASAVVAFLWLVQYQPL